MAHREIRAHCKLNEECQSLLKATMAEMGFSARAHDKILRVARTIADLEGASQIQTPHLSEAINYRLLDRSFWT
jgi:magnesium chelatase family protein